MTKKTNKEIRESKLKPAQVRRKKRAKQKEETAMEYAFRQAMKKE
ncbi:hypothetical protein [Lysinibacillus antri]|nr:hypothetical protein [Lysinibacillus antri]